MNIKQASLPILSLLLTGVLQAVTPTATELDTSKVWFDRSFASVYPFSFEYDGASSRAFLQHWKKETSQRDLDKDRSEFTLVFTSPDNDLQVSCRGILYHDFPTVEWTLFFKNISSSNSKVLKNIRSFDLIYAGNGPLYQLHHLIGSRDRADDFKPMITWVGSKSRGKELPATVESIKLASAGGRGSDATWPYFNIEANGQGMIAAIGWPGQWEVEFKSGNGGLAIIAGQSDCNFYLTPGEEIRSPLSVVQFWQRSLWVDAQNVWRQWMIKHNVYRPEGRLHPYHLSAAMGGYLDNIKDNNSGRIIDWIDQTIAGKLPISYWWMDAAWYPTTSATSWWEDVGTWEVDKVRFPGGIREVTDHAKRFGVKSIVWFEPERAGKNSQVAREHPSWLLERRDNPRTYLFNLGNIEARRWMAEHLDTFMKREGIDLYRQDFNLAPLVFWRENDETNRQGITENKYVSGYLAFWDELLARDPQRMIDSCASGGRRNDLESMRRGLPLHRSDFVYEPSSQQAQTMGLSLWLPFHGTGTRKMDTYNLRSVLVPYINLAPNMAGDTLNFDRIRSDIELWLKYICPLYTEDFYPLVPYSVQHDQWMAWQYNSAEKGKGVIQVFRRQESQYSEMALRLYALDETADYVIRDLDTNKVITHKGSELMSAGLVVRMEEPASAKIFAYEKIE